MTRSLSKSKAGFTKANMDAVSDNPAWTKATTARSKSFDETFPDLARRARGPQKAPTKTQVTLRLDARVVDHFEATGQGWQMRINEALKKAAGL
ncbi:BrnA antitoxin family protein [Bradyrhizobium sp. STM 3843]|uniref:BrnA antitoxin family protein n=1 Tax=Bradyrhizobium sp. STM 3843 TaxID=551947 RepID=UPI00056B93D8|nr:BrnA antitoxin family protein [Bradyrhizobium sp. STM 3843]